jgi:hypothetical protein
MKNNDKANQFMCEQLEKCLVFKVRFVEVKIMNTEIRNRRIELLGYKLNWRI